MLWRQQCCNSRRSIWLNVTNLSNGLKIFYLRVPNETANGSRLRRRCDVTYVSKHVLSFLLLLQSFLSNPKFTDCKALNLTLSSLTTKYHTTDNKA